MQAAPTAQAAVKPRSSKGMATVTTTTSEGLGYVGSAFRVERQEISVIFAWWQ